MHNTNWMNLLRAHYSQGDFATAQALARFLFPTWRPVPPPSTASVSALAAVLMHNQRSLLSMLRLGLRQSQLAPNTARVVDDTPPQNDAHLLSRQVVSQMQCSACVDLQQVFLLLLGKVNHLLAGPRPNADTKNTIEVEFRWHFAVEAIGLFEHVKHSLAKCTRNRSEKFTSRTLVDYFDTLGERHRGLFSVLMHTPIRQERTKKIAVAKQDLGKWARESKHQQSGMQTELCRRWRVSMTLEKSRDDHGYVPLAGQCTSIRVQERESLELVPSVLLSFSTTYTIPRRECPPDTWNELVAFSSEQLISACKKRAQTAFLIKRQLELELEYTVSPGADPLQRNVKHALALLCIIAGAVQSVITKNTQHTHKNKRTLGNFDS